MGIIWRHVYNMTIIVAGTSENSHSEYMYMYILFLALALSNQQ